MNRIDHTMEFPVPITNSPMGPNDPMDKNEVVAVTILIFLILAAMIGFAANLHDDAAAATRQQVTAKRISTMRPACPGHPMPSDLCGAIRLEAPKVGVPKSWSRNRSLALLLHRESSFDHCAVNPSKHDCLYLTRKRHNHACGWGQFLPCRCFPDKLDQANCILRYIKGRYRTPERALSFHKKNGYY